MVRYARWSMLVTVLVCVLAILFAIPNFFIGDDEQTSLPGWLPQSQLTLGLDLQGGSHLLLAVGIEDVVKESLETTEDTVRRALRETDGGRIGRTDLGIEGNSVVFNLRDRADIERTRQALFNAIDNTFNITNTAGGAFRIELTEQAVVARRDAVLAQTIEVLRRRIDELGTTEPVIQQQGQERILVQVPGVDPTRLKEILGRTAKLTIHVVDSSVSFEDAQAGNLPAGTIMLPDLDNPGTDLPVFRASLLGGERLTQAQATFGQQGGGRGAVVSFTFDSTGGRIFGEFTQQNVGERLAIVLDDEVISAPRVQSAILGGSGIITGNFTFQEAEDLALLLRAGALPAPLVILEERTVGPGLGADSIAAGKLAAIVGMALVLIYMIASYGLFGVMANVALLFNIALIVASLSVLQATLTLPGIAGIVLTIGMAVDANVLIFERIREEVRSGRSVIAAVDSGYKRAITTIIDANLTTLIAAILLFQFGTGPIKGFAVTLSIGVVSSMFTAIMVTRLLIVIWLRRARPTTLAI